MRTRSDYLYIATIGRGAAPVKLTSMVRTARELEPNWAPAPKVAFTQASMGLVGSPRMTRDGQVIVFSKDEGRGFDLWLFEVS